MRWECDDCATHHSKNPRRCKNCGHTVFSPARGSDGDGTREFNVPWWAYAAIGLALVILTVVVL